MLLDDFYLLSSFCRNLLIASNNSANLNPPLKRFAALLSLLLCSPKHNEHVYFTESEPLTPTGHICSAFNQNITLRFSSTFLLLDKFSFYDMYLILYRLRDEYSAAKIDSTFSIKMVELCQKLKALTFYFCSNEAMPEEIAQKDSYGNISFLEHRNSSGDIKIFKNIELPPELRIIIDEVAPIIVSDLITEYITKLSISLNFDTKKQNIIQNGNQTVSLLACCLNYQFYARKMHLPVNVPIKIVITYLSLLDLTIISVVLIVERQLGAAMQELNNKNQLRELQISSLKVGYFPPFPQKNSAFAFLISKCTIFSYFE